MTATKLVIYSASLFGLCAAEAIWAASAGRSWLAAVSAACAVINLTTAFGAAKLVRK